MTDAGALSGARAAGGGIFGCQAQALVRAGDLSYEELTLFYLSRIREIEVTREISECRDQSESCVRRESAGTRSARRAAPDVERDPIYGMPILLKDNINAAGMATTAGAVALQNNFADDAFVVEKMREKGAVILGKANLVNGLIFL